MRGKKPFFENSQEKKKERRLLERVYSRSSLMGYFSVTKRSGSLLHIVLYV